MAKAVQSVEEKDLNEVDVQAIRDAWYKYSAYVELMKGGAVNDDIEDRYIKAHSAYTSKGEELLLKYFGIKVTNSVNITWSCDFVTGRMTVTR